MDAVRRIPERDAQAWPIPTFGQYIDISDVVLRSVYDESPAQEVLSYG